MNNKSDKKHKPKPKPKPKPKNKKKTMSQPKNKNGGAFSLFGLFSGNKKETSNNETELEPLLQSNSAASNASTNPQHPNSTNPPPPQPELPNIQPNAKPQGFNTIKAQSRCSIM